METTGIIGNINIWCYIGNTGVTLGIDWDNGTTI